MDNKKREINGVDCDVSTCAYNKDNKHCCAEHICICANCATTSCDTACATFKRK